MSVPVINKKETLKRTKAVLKSYRSLCRIAGTQIAPKITQTYSFEPRSFTGTVSKALENQVLRKVNAEYIISDIEKAINKIHDVDKRIILIEKYCSNEEIKDVAIMNIVKIYGGEFYRELEKALFWFAEFYKNGELQVFNTNSLEYELIYKNLSYSFKNGSNL